MKLYSKILTFALSAVLTMSFISCSSQQNEIIPEYTVEKPEVSQINFLGADFVFLQRNDEHSTGEDYFGYVIGTEFADLAMKRIKEVEDKYNVNVKVVTGLDITRTIRNETYSGLIETDAVQGSSNELKLILRGGLLYDLRLVSEYLDYTDSDKWGSVEVLKPLFWDGCIYGVVPTAWPIIKYRSMDGPMVVNEDIIQYLNQTDPREFAERDEWTWDKLEELMPIYHHTNDAGEEVKALYTTIHWLFRTIQSTNGDGFVVQDNNGNYQLGLHTAKTYEAMDTAWEWAFGDYSSFVYIDLNNGWTNMLQAFLDQKSVLTIMNGTDLMGSENSIAYQMDNFGVIPFPRGDYGDNNKTTGSTITDTRFSTSLPVLCKDPEMSAIILDAIYEPLEGYETEESIIDYLRRNFFFDDRDVLNYVNAYNNIYYNYRNEGITDVYISINDSKSLAEWFEQFSDPDERNRQEFVVNIETSIDEVLG